MDIRLLLADAVAQYNAGDLARAGFLLNQAAMLQPDNAPILFLKGQVELAKKNFAEAARLFDAVLAAGPAPAKVHFSRGHALWALHKFKAAEQAYAEAARLAPDDPAILCDLGAAREALNDPDGAAQCYRDALSLYPTSAKAAAGLATILATQIKIPEAEETLRAAAFFPHPPEDEALLQAALAFTLGKQGERTRALTHIEQARRLSPCSPRIAHQHAALLQHLGRHEEAIDTYNDILSADPLDFDAHMNLNEIYYRLGRDGEFLSSYDMAALARPESALLPAMKGRYLLKTGRAAEAHDSYARALTLEPDDASVISGMARALEALGDHARALGLHARNVNVNPDSANARCDFASLLLRTGEPRQALPELSRAAELDPDNQSIYAVEGLCHRALNDNSRDDALNLYEDSIQVFDLEPPEGYADMAGFNRDLCAYLNALHTDKREYVSQTLKDGTRLFDDVFNNGHHLADLLRLRIDRAVSRYIADMRTHTTHPFLRRRRNGAYYTGSWSSRMVGRGHHTNHVHPRGWISSCYYVAVPDAAEDAAKNQGWIKFGEPSAEFGDGFKALHMIKPAPGRLVLFPSYMWHGTIPFQCSTQRMTIAFDILPRK